MPSHPAATFRPTLTCPRRVGTRPPHHQSPGCPVGGVAGAPGEGGKAWAVLPYLLRGRPGTPPPPEERSPLPPTPRPQRRRGVPSLAKGQGTRRPHPHSSHESGAEKLPPPRRRRPSRFLPDSPAGERNRPSRLRPPPRPRRACGDAGGRAQGPAGPGSRRPRSSALTGRSAAGLDRF